MKTYESGWENKENLAFYVRSWVPDKIPKAVVALVHGHGEHVGRYAHVGKAFTGAGYALSAFDLRGHGRSGGPRGHAPNYEALLDDVADFLALVVGRFPKLPVFLYGHSTGGNLVLNYTLRRNPDVVGVIVTDPWLKLAFDVPIARLLMAKVMDKIAPGFTQDSGLETAAISRDPEIVKAYGNDPLVHEKISVRFFMGIYDSGLWAIEHAPEFPVPLLLMQGTGDRIVSAQANHEFAERAGKKATWRAWDGLYHEIHNEPEKAQVLKAMIDWMDKRLKKK
jgi:alpha-beta hydrolase superfamily lysophospholipase